MTIDWTKPIEAVREDGQTFEAHTIKPGHARWSYPGERFDRHTLVEPWVGADGQTSWGGWRVRNVATRDDTVTPEHPTPTQYAPELVERMVALCRMIAGPPLAQGNVVGLATAIVSDLPQEVDPDLIEARAIIAGFEIAPDDDVITRAVQAGIARGRQLQRGEAA